MVDKVVSGEVFVLVVDAKFVVKILVSGKVIVGRAVVGIVAGGFAESVVADEAEVELDVIDAPASDWPVVVAYNAVLLPFLKTFATEQ